MFERAGIVASVRTQAAAVGREHYHLGAAPWLVQARLALDELPWLRAAAEDGAPDARADAARRLARLCWGVAAAAGRLRTPVGALTLVDDARPLTLELTYELHAADFASLLDGPLSTGVTGTVRFEDRAWRADPAAAAATPCAPSAPA